VEEEVIKKAEVLVEAYPYIREYRDKVFIIKCGGSIFRSSHLKESILKDIAFLEAVGIKTLMICGGGPFITEEIEKRGKKPVFVDGLRVTDEDTLKIVKDVLFSVRDDIVKYLTEELKVEAVPLLPEERFMLARKIHYQRGEEVVDLGFVGQVGSVNTEYINDKLKKEHVLIIAPLVYGEDNNLYNLNGDSVAAGIAEAMRAEKLIFITDVLGVMRNPQNPDTLISVLQVSDAEELINKNIIKEGMIPKVRASLSSIKKGVEKVHIVSGNLSHSIILEIFTEHGVGTEILK
jgi:acetylglutamate kinase